MKLDWNSVTILICDSWYEKLVWSILVLFTLILLCGTYISVKFLEWCEVYSLGTAVVNRSLVVSWVVVSWMVGG